MKKYVISLIQVVFICSYGFGQISKTTLKTNLTGVNYSTLQMSDLITGQLKIVTLVSVLGYWGN